MARIVKHVVATSGFGRIAGKAIMVFVLVGAMAAVPLAASANYGNDESAPSDGSTQVDGSFGSFGDLQNTDDETSGFGTSEDDVAEDGDNGSTVDGGDEAVEDGTGPETVEPDAIEPEAIEAVEEMTGTDSEEINDALDEQSLADYAAQFGVSEDQLVTSVVAEIEANVSLAVANGELTQEQADEILATVPDEVAALVNAEGLGDDDGMGDDDAGDDGTGDDGVDDGTGDEADDGVDDGIGEDTDDGAGEDDADDGDVDDGAEDDADGAEDENGDDGAATFDEDFGVIAAVESLTGASADEITAALNAGQSLAAFAAGYGVSEGELVNALVTNIQLHVNAAVESGFLTQEQADEMLLNVENHVMSMVRIPGGFPMDGFGDDAVGVPDDGDSGEEDAESEAPEDASEDGSAEEDASADDQTDTGDLDPLGAIAEVTGTTPEDVVAGLGSGQTLAEFGEQNGVGVDELVGALLANIEEELAAAVASGDLDQAQADEMLANFTGLLTAVFNGDILDDIIGSDDPEESEEECGVMPEDFSSTGAAANGDFAASICPGDSD
jgi:uncharacterized protein YidB (DUF937 family)